MSMKQAYSVAQITNYIRNMFAEDFVLSKVCVSGEISNCKYHSSGHVYFTLKDEKASIACIMFASDRAKLSFRLSDGMKVQIDGRIDVYERDGRYQLYARSIKQEGEGLLYERFMLLKAELEERGMFAAEYKRPIPRYVRKLGVVTAPTGAAVRDIIQITTRRNPWVQIILYPAQVQGEGAAQSIVKGIHALEEQKVDVIIAGRGGGSIEDLWAFNEEIVAEAIFESEIPIISAVGHETDFTIADFVADLRAPTPSAAAELAVEKSSDVIERFESHRELLYEAMTERILDEKNRLQSLKLKMGYLSPENQIRQKRMRTADLEEKLSDLMKRQVENKRHELAIYINMLHGLSPLDKLNQGYSVSVGETGRRIRSVGDVTPGENLKIFVSDGYVESRVENTVAMEKAIDARSIYG